MKRENQTLCALWWKDTPWSTVLPKGLDLSLLYLDPCVNIQRKEEHAELHHEYVNSKIQIGDNAIQDQVLQLINFKEEKGEPTDSKYTLRYWYCCNGYFCGRQLITVSWHTEDIQSGWQSSKTVSYIFCLAFGIYTFFSKRQK